MPPNAVLPGRPDCFWYWARSPLTALPPTPTWTQLLNSVASAAVGVLSSGFAGALVCCALAEEAPVRHTVNNEAQVPASCRNCLRFHEVVFMLVWLEG